MQMIEFEGEMKFRINAIDLLYFSIFLISANAAAESFNLSAHTKSGDIRCLIAEEPVDATLSSDDEAVIVSGISYLMMHQLCLWKTG
jgi:hypothetical protein